MSDRDILCFREIGIINDVLVIYVFCMYFVKNGIWSLE